MIEKVFTVLRFGFSYCRNSVYCAINKSQRILQPFGIRMHSEAIVVKPLAIMDSMISYTKQSMLSFFFL